MGKAAIYMYMYVYVYEMDLPHPAPGTIRLKSGGLLSSKVVVNNVPSPRSEF